MLRGKILTVQTSPRQLTTHTDTDGLTIEPSKFGWVLTSNIWDMASYLLLIYRDPNNTSNFTKIYFAIPVEDIAASSWSLTWQAGLQFNWKKKAKFANILDLVYYYVCNKKLNINLLVLIMNLFLK